MVRVSTPGLYKGDPYAPLTEAQAKTGGRNHYGRITTRHKGGGSKQHYRVVDFKRDKEGIACRVERVEYDPNRTAHIALLLLRRRRAPLHHRAEGREGWRSADGRARCADQVGQFAAVAQYPDRRHRALRRDEAGQGRADRTQRRRLGAADRARKGYATLRLRSGEMRKVPVDCSATIGEVGNSEHNLRKLGKAGAKRWRGIRPTVRGAAMNPVDHPHGGGEAKAGQGNPHPVSPWGQPSKGYKTRKNKRTTQFIVRDRRG